ncbi:MAG: TPM domain-containing protein [Gallionella sp.]|nr:TPM domain-containing protein [Gallionella sp.]
MKIIAQVVLLALLLSGAARAEVAIPLLTQRVTDLTATLDAKQTEWLESRLAEFEAKKGAQLAVLIVPTTQPETIEQFSIRVVEAWKLGHKKVDDGALLLVAKDDRKLRIEVGYGLEGVLPDAIAKRIIAETITPFFKNCEFYAGINAGTTAMMQVINEEPLPSLQKIATPLPQQTAVKNCVTGESLPPPQQDVGGSSYSASDEHPFWFLLFLVCSIFIVVVRLFGLGGGRHGGSFGGGGGSFGGGGASGSW